MLFKNKKEEAAQINNNLVNEIRKQYKVLTALVPSTYEVKSCPRCFENKMEVNNISPTGQSVEYQCANCKKELIGRILPGKDSSEAVNQINIIRQLMSSFVEPLSPDFYKIDIDNSFIVKNSFDNSTDKYRRSLIPESVRNEVWRRDQGRCVNCGSQECLEFDHIIPLSKGGSNTTRNIQLLCMNCNRAKSDKI